MGPYSKEHQIKLIESEKLEKTSENERVFSEEGDEQMRMFSSEVHNCVRPNFKRMAKIIYIRKYYKRNK